MKGNDSGLHSSNVNSLPQNGKGINFGGGSQGTSQKKDPAGETPFTGAQGSRWQYLHLPTVPVPNPPHPMSVHCDVDS